ncbi:MAG: histidine kinase [Bacteroidota bacterium]
MMLFSKKHRIKYLGFNDIWFMIIGIVFLSFVTDYLFENSFKRYPLPQALLSWSISLLFATFDWTIIRAVIIWLRKKYPRFQDDLKRIVLLFAAIVLVVIGIDALVGLILSILNDVPFYYPNRFSKVQLPIIIISTMTMAIYEAIYYNIRLQKSIRQEEQNKQAIVQAQLDALSNRSQPHFFFNSLNTLRDIIDHNTKEEAKLFVDKLSDVYRFILHTGKNNQIRLEEEIAFAKAYAHVQSERFGENLKIGWRIPKKVLHSSIIPTSLQLLIENAIKHNVVSKSQPLKINVFEKGGDLVVENRLQPKSSKIPSTKLGLKNLKQRYALLTERPLEIYSDQIIFRVSLPLLTEEKNTYAGIDH